MKKENYKIIIAILVTAIIVGVSVFIWSNSQKNTGFIEGALSYPSDYIPKDMQVCAENTETKKEYCTNNQIHNTDEYTYGLGYKMEVPTGDYQVYAYLPESPEWKAYYSNYVVCIDSGLYENCNSHDIVTISVLNNQVTSNINPGDWYK
ncbi:MAG: hypothetical protein ABID64_00905 [Nitrospirota bacterium]